MSDVENKGARRGWLKWLLIGLFFLWLAAGLSAYYLVQNAFLQPFISLLPEIKWLAPRVDLAAIGRALVDMAAALWITFVALGSGRWFLRRIRPGLTQTLDEALFGLGLGFGFLGFIMLALGLVGLLQPAVLLGLLAALTVLTGRSTLRFLRRVAAPRPRLLVALFVLISFTLALLLALQPPTSWDGLFYHLTGPKLYLAAGRIGPGIDIPHLNFPALFEMLFMAGMIIGGDSTAMLLHFVFAFMLLGLVYGMARDLLNLHNAWPAVLFLLAMPMLLNLAGWAYNDLGLAFYEVAALCALLKWRRAGIRTLSGDTGLVEEQEAGNDGRMANPAAVGGRLVLAGIMMGLAMGLKYTSVVALLTLMLLIAWWGRSSLKQVWRPVLLFGGLAFLVASPWFVKNLVFSGNPVYPFVFGGQFWDDFRADAYSESGTGIAFNPETCRSEPSEFLVGQHVSGCAVDPLYLARKLLTLPFDLTLGIKDASRDGNPGPLFLVFLPLLLFYGLVQRSNSRPAAIDAMLFFALIQVLFWTAGVVVSAPLWQSRLLLPAFVVLCPVLAWLLEDLARYDQRQLSLQRLLYLVMGGVLLVGLVIQLLNWLPQQPWAYLTGAETREQNLERRLGPHYQAMTTINRELPDEAVVLFLWEPRSYYCQRDCRPDSILDAFGHDQYLYGDAADISKAWQAEGISHVLLYRRGLDFILDENSPGEEPLPEPPALIDLQRTYLELLPMPAAEGYELYRLKDSG